jgi:hypothetical protein
MTVGGNVSPSDSSLTSSFGAQMIADVAILASMTFASREVEAEIKEVERHVVQDEHAADKEAKKGRSAAVRERINHASNKTKNMKIKNNHGKEHHFNIQQPTGGRN